MILVDTSAWIEFFRGRETVASRVSDALGTGEASICGPIVTELRRGLRNKADRRKVLPLLDGCRHLEQPANLWEDAGDLGAFLGRRGATVKTLDLLIAAYAINYSIGLLTTDSDFSLMQQAGVEIHVVK